MDGKQNEIKSSLQAGFGNDGQIVIKNRAYRRRWKNRAMLEGRPSKKWYTTKHGRGKKKK